MRHTTELKPQSQRCNCELRPIWFCEHVFNNSVHIWAHPRRKDGSGAGVPMKTSENGAPILSGSGLKTVQERIAQEFERVRTVERRRYVRPGELDSTLVGRRKDDQPRPQLAQLAQPILQQIKATRISASQPHHRNHGAAMWDIGEAPEVSDAELPRLLSECEVALGFKKPQLDLRTQISAQPEKKSIWQRDIFGKAR